MALWVGTSGYNYPEWRGSFYPQKMPTARMLPFYAERFKTVEINYTFYRAPSAKILAGWSDATPAEFQFTLKAPKRLTHVARLKDCAEPLRYFMTTAETLGSKQGVLFFQLPPSLKKDLGLLEAFVEPLPPSVRAAFEFRHPSWLDDDVFAALRERNLALCIADSEKASTPLEITADFAYFRLRDEGYTAADIERWAHAIEEKTRGAKDVYVYFKHEESGTGPAFGKLFLEALGLGH
jgi:uncharacterized protein YecE (DUF72 family)